MTAFLKVFDGNIKLMLQREFSDYTENGLRADVGSLVVPLQNRDGEPAELTARKYKKKNVYLPISRVYSETPAPTVTIKASSPDGRAGISLTVQSRAKCLDYNAEVSLSVFADSSLALDSTNTYNFKGTGIDYAAKIVAQKVVTDMYRGLFLSNQQPVNDDTHLFAMAVEGCADNMVKWLLSPLYNPVSAVDNILD